MIAASIGRNHFACFKVYKSQGSSCVSIALQYVHMQTPHLTCTDKVLAPFLILSPPPIFVTLKLDNQTHFNIRQR